MYVTERKKLICKHDAIETFKFVWSVIFTQHYSKRIHKSTFSTIEIFSTLHSDKDKHLYNTKKNFICQHVPVYIYIYIRNTPN